MFGRWTIVLALVAASLGAAPPRTQRPVGPGIYRPQFPVSPAEAEVPVPAFHLDVTPGTNREFLSFVLEHPEWRRDRVPRLFADIQYLSSWASPTSLGSGPDAVDPDAPVTQVSWFAAKSYCESRSGTLPTINQWELAAAASETLADATQDAAFIQTILSWYARPNPRRLPPVGRGTPNLWGIQDLHGLAWEWTLDFNSDLVATDARNQDDPDRLAFCGTGALGASDSGNYASFMRVAMRTSLKASYTTNNLGFRCASAATPEPT